MPRLSNETNDRFTMQIPPVQKARLVRAASLAHTTLKDFMLRNALNAADVVINHAERMELDEEQRRYMLKLLDNPPKANKKLRAAAELLAAQE